MKRIQAWMVVLLLVSAVLGGCNSHAPQLTASPAAQQTQAGVQLTLTASAVPPEPSPTATDTPQPGLVVLLAPPGSDTALTSRLFDELQPRFTELGLLWQTQASLGSVDLAGTHLRLVIALPPDPGLAALAAAAPQTQFLALGIPGLQPAANLNLVGPDGVRSDRLGFIAGVIAAMITPDWRVGVLAPPEPAQALQARQGFINGAVYYCGLCLPYHGPTNVDYPVYWDLPTGAGVEEIQAALQGLKDLAVTTVYLPPGILNAELVAALAGIGLQIIGSQAPPSELADQWVVSVFVDPLPAVLDLLPALLEGQGGHSLDVDIALLNINPSLFSPGRQERAFEILAELQAGYIDPGLDLLEP